jgi:hypothetical protein
MQFGANGGTGTLSVSASRDCTWSVSSQASWVALASTPNGNGDASVSYTVARNTVPSSRAAELVVESQRIQLSQAAAACTYSIERTADTVAATGGTLTIQLSTLTECAWTASTTASWLTFGRNSGSASAAIDIVVAANTGAARSGAVTVGGQTYTVTQAAAAGSTPTPEPTPTPTPTPTPSPTPTPTPLPTPISLAGMAAAVGGSCPNLHFSLSGRTVTTDRDTRYSRGKCGDVSDGDTLTVDGMLQADGTVTAEAITINKNEK